MEILVPAARKTIQRVGLSNLAGLLLLGAALGSLVYGIREVFAGIDPRPLLVVSLVGALLGWALAGTKISGWLAALVAWFAGATIILLGIARLGKPIMELASAAVGWFRQALFLWRINPETPSSLSPAALQAAWQGFAQAGQTLWERLSAWSLALVSGHPVYDALAIQLVWASLVWFAGVWAAWWVCRRRQPLVGLAPAGVLLAASLAYSDAAVYAMVAWIGIVVALQALASYQQRWQSWWNQHVDLADIQGEWSMAVILIVAGLMVAAWFLPSISIRDIADRISQAFTLSEQADQNIADALGIKRRPQTANTTLERSQIPGLPNRHLIGSGPELSKRVVMWVTLAETRPDPARPAYYWRAVTYDRYAYWGWYSYPTETTSLLAGQSIQTELLDQESAPGETIHQKVTLQRKAGGLLYVAGELQQVSQDSLAAWHRPGDLFGAELQTNNYSAVSHRSLPTVEQLRQAGDVYPEWVREAYLPLAKSLPQRVWDLALDLTVTKPTAYDRALAIQAYLRTFPYTLDLEPPPSGRDLVDYFLFDLKRGYCDYYASAMVVLARAADLPARLVVGYASGVYQSQETRYTVTEADAHAWAEIYFPGYGWIEFEPTANRAVINPIAEEIPSKTPQAQPEISTRDEVKIGWTPRRLLQSLLVVMISALLLLAAWEIGDRLRLGKLPPQQAVVVIYRRLYRQGQLIQTGPAVSLTPHEFAARLIQTLGSRSATPARTPQHVQRLVDLYARVTYGPRPADQADRLAALRDWYNLRGSLWLIRFKQIIWAIKS